MANAKIGGPSELTSLTEDQLVRSANSPDIYRKDQLKRVSGPSELKNLKETDIIRSKNSPDIYYSPDYKQPVVTPTDIQKRETNIDAGAGEDTTLPVPDYTMNMSEELSKAYNKSYSEVDQALLKLQQDREIMAQEKIRLAEQQRSDAALGLGEARGLDLEAERKRLEEEQGIKEKEDALVEIQGLMADLNEQYGLTDAAIKGKNINSAIIRGQQQMAYDAYAAKATGLSARADIIQGQYDRAASRVESYFNIVDAKRTEDLNYYSKLIDMADNNIINFSTEERDAINGTVNILLDKQNRDVAERDNKIALMLDPNLAMAFQQSGATMDMNYEDIIQKMQPSLAAILTAEWNDKFGVSSGGGTGTGSAGSSGFTQKQMIDMGYITVDENGMYVPNEAKIDALSKNDVELRNSILDAQSYARSLNNKYNKPGISGQKKTTSDTSESSAKKYGASYGDIVKKSNFLGTVDVIGSAISKNTGFSDFISGVIGGNK